MRTFIAIIVGLLGGFVLGIALSSFIGILGMTLFNMPLGIKFMPYFTAIICAIIVPIWDHKQKNG
ncbi:hypothetical protein SAMN04487943_102281 [Gracilibacillus orientalis]|uniref:Uncharacterized protein n=1 Tax=Gracilibacillus orientalis TaxID=334253 RepID=A0A1I4IT08_9BACI|nr:DUF5957 family protein [Gracilibacillus orientalis]SFL57440.1 hypothetical protein SAMN04487943_102281 [Gracilibacillus orientalis]